MVSADQNVSWFFLTSTFFVSSECACILRRLFAALLNWYFLLCVFQSEFEPSRGNSSGSSSSTGSSLGRGSSSSNDGGELELTPLLVTDVLQQATRTMFGAIGVGMYSTEVVQVAKMDADDSKSRPAQSMDVDENSGEGSSNSDSDFGLDSKSMTQQRIEVVNSADAISIEKTVANTAIIEMDSSAVVPVWGALTLLGEYSGVRCRVLVLKSSPFLLSLGR